MLSLLLSVSRLVPHALIQCLTTCKNTYIFSALVVLSFEFQIPILNGLLLFACNTLFKLSLDINSPLKEQKRATKKKRERKASSFNMNHHCFVVVNVQCSMLMFRYRIGYRLLVRSLIHPLHIFKLQIQQI